ncbi:MAG: FkbM family methyltransferase [Alphaproteobacteria bacterium]|nr:FkbM family methyltransferase [Alphaproteobacteria bacterium]
MSANPFQQPYLASNDNRSIVGIDCPVCHQRNRAIPLKSVPANQAVRIFIDKDLKMRTLGNTNIPYGDPSALSEDMRSDSPLTFWRCESCDLVFQRNFDDWDDRQLYRQVYNAAYVKILPQVSTELPQYRSRFLHKLFRDSIQSLKVLICESRIGTLAEELGYSGVKAESYRLFDPSFRAKGLGSYDLICAFSMMERMPDPVKMLKNLIALCNTQAAILVTRYPFNHHNEKEHVLLSPRNGFFRIYSEKSLNLIFKSLQMNFIHLTPTMTLLYRKLPAYAEFLKEAKISEEAIMNDESNDSFNGAENADVARKNALHETDNFSGNHASPSQVEVHTERISIRDTRYGKTAYNHYDSLVGMALENYGEYLTGDQELLRQLIRPNWTVFEVAANIGVHCMMMAPMLGQGGHIHAFEPYEESYKLLGTNLLLNNIDNVSTYQEALGAFPGVTRLAVTNPDKPGSMAAKGWSQQYSGSEVSLATLDALEPPQCHFMHICAPECEPAVLQGGQKTLTRFSPALLVNCVSRRDFISIFSLLTELGYRLYWHIQPFYLEDNFFGNSENVFGNAGAAKILALHSNKDQNVGLTKIRSQNDWIA